jgi:hypothetical protein
MRQPPLFPPALTCHFGSAWPDVCGTRPCARCRAETDRLIAKFWQQVASGGYDAEGYTPAERAAQRRKDRAA